MRTFYNGYCFSSKRPPSTRDALIYNPTLALYFLGELARYCEYPERILDSNLAMDRNRIHFVAGLPHGERLVTKALAANETNPDEDIFIRLVPVDNSLIFINFMNRLRAKRTDSLTNRFFLLSIRPV